MLDFIRRALRVAARIYSIFHDILVPHYFPVHMSPSGVRPEPWAKEGRHHLAMPRILVINPNSSVAVTQAIDHELDSLRPRLNLVREHA